MADHQGDILLENTADGGDILIEGGIATMTPGLETSVYASLFTDPGWWGAEFDGNLAKAIRDTALTSSTRLTFEEAAEADLAWLIEDGIAERVEVQALIVGPKRLQLAVEIDGEQAGPYSINFAESFDSEPNRPEQPPTPPPPEVVSISSDPDSVSGSLQMGTFTLTDLTVIDLTDAANYTQPMDSVSGSLQLGTITLTPV